MADLERIFWLVSFLFGVYSFLGNDLNKSDLFLFNGKYLEGFLFKLEYNLKKFFTILSSKEWKLTTTNMPPFDRSCAAVINPRINSVNSWLTKILIAWKVFVAGFFLYLL